MMNDREDRGENAPADKPYVIVVHSDYEQELRRVIDADEELRDRVNLMRGEIGMVDDRINIVPMKSVVDMTLAEFGTLYPPRQAGWPGHPARTAPRSTAQWKREKNRFRR